MTTTLDALLDMHRRDAQALDNAAQARVLRVLLEARVNLSASLVATSTGQLERRHIAAILTQVVATTEALGATLTTTLTATKREQVAQAEATLSRTIVAMEDVAPLRLDILAQMTQDGTLLLHKHSVARYTNKVINEAQAHLVRAVATQQTWAQTARGIEAIMRTSEPHALMITRMENMQAYDIATNTAADALYHDPEDPYMMMADEHIDGRNHPFSRALDKKLRPLKGTWKVPIAEVLAAAKGTRYTSGGILWPKQGAYYVGATYPAHYNDRGSATIVKASWL